MAILVDPSFLVTVLLVFLGRSSVTDGAPLLTDVVISRHDVNAVNLTCFSSGAANHTNSTTRVVFGWAVDVSETAWQSHDNFGTSYGPSDWSVVASDATDSNGWVVQRSI